MNSKDLRNIDQAYSSIYEEQIEAGQHPGKSPDKATRDKYETQSRRGTAPKGVGVPDKSVGYGQLKQDVDMFELVKGHLMSEGYADDEKAALAIMANMSEQWKDSIVEIKMSGNATNNNKTTKVAQSTPADRARRAVQNQRDGYHGDDDALNKGMEALQKSMGRLKGV